MALSLSYKLFKNKIIGLKPLNCGLAAQTNPKTYDDIPGPKSIPYFGNLFNLKQFGKFDFILFIEKHTTYVIKVYFETNFLIFFPQCNKVNRVNHHKAEKF